MSINIGLSIDHGTSSQSSNKSGSQMFQSTPSIDMLTPEPDKTTKPVQKHVRKRRIIESNSEPYDLMTLWMEWRSNADLRLNAMLTMLW